jgi:cephalosporin hydroxylase
MHGKYVTENELVNKSYTIGMAQHKEEILGLTKFLLKKKPHNIMEIGSKHGGTFNIFASIATGKKISLDLPGGIHGGWALNEHPYLGNVVEKRNMYFEEKFDDVYMVLGDSHDTDTLYEIQSILDGDELDFLLIDGDHTYEGVKQDYDMYKHLVKPGGYIALHDINDTEQHRDLNVYVCTLWDELEGNKKEFNVHKDWGGIGVIKNVK